MRDTRSLEHARTTMSSADPTVRVPPRRHGRVRRAIFRAAETIARWCGGRAFYRAAYLSRGRFRVREEDVRVRDLAAGLAGFRIAQISDLHAGPFLARGDLAHVVAAVNALAPDVCAITGDLISHHWTEALLVLDELAELRARHGVFAVLGNHDYKDRLEGRIVEAYGARGLRVLRNEGVRISVAGGALALTGLEDLEEARVIDLERARAAIEPGDVEVVLCHNPAQARRIARERCACILSGHTHGTQIDLPWLRGLGPEHPGSRLLVGETVLIVNGGLGVVGVPLRIGSPPEIVLVRLVAETDA
jgi:predicted MPP superfamily phosphohydrolase